MYESLLFLGVIDLFKIFCVFKNEYDEVLKLIVVSVCLFLIFCCYNWLLILVGCGVIIV